MVIGDSIIIIPCSVCIECCRLLLLGKGAHYSLPRL